MTLLAHAAEMTPELVALRRSLHQIPEVGLDLPLTQKAILAALDGLPYEIHCGQRTTSVVAVLRGPADGPVVLLRADMDGLAVAEETGLDYASTNGAMHACGHDLHMTGLVGAARLLAAHADELAGTVVLMFQPGEEGHAGARVMIDEGLLDIVGRTPDAAYAIHVWASVKRGLFVTRPGAIMASANDFTVTINGTAAHGSVPYTGLDPVPIAAEVILGLQSLVTRQIDVFDPVVLSVARMSAGGPVNAVPPRATLEGGVRTLSTAAIDHLEMAIPRLADGIAAAYGATATTAFHRQYPVTINDRAEADFTVRTLRSLFGDDRVDVPETPMMGSEDFSFVLEKVPGAFILLGAQPPEVPDEGCPTNHSSLVRFDDSVVADQAVLLATLAIDRLRELAG